MTSEIPKDLFQFNGIKCMSFNADKSQCAVCANDKDVVIYKVNGFDDYSKWTKLYTLKAHFLVIMAIDWNPITNKIITCSIDRNIYIWQYNKEKNLWNPELVFAKSKLSFLCVKWSKNGELFVAGNCSKQILIGKEDTQNKLWSASVISCHKSAVTCVDFNHDSSLVIAGSTDLKFSIHSFVLGDKISSEEILYEKISNAWINDVAYSTTGKTAFVVSHDAVFATVDSTTNKITTVNLRHSPCEKIVVIDDDNVLLIGYDRHIYKYVREDSDWKLKNTITKIENINNSTLLNESVASNSTTNTNTNNTESNSGVSTKTSIFERMKQFDVSHQQKKSSILITGGSNNKTEEVVKNSKNMHGASINSFALLDNNKVLVTSDMSGFVKKWDI